MAQAKPCGRAWDAGQAGCLAKAGAAARRRAGAHHPGVHCRGTSRLAPGAEKPGRGAADRPHPLLQSPDQFHRLAKWARARPFFLRGDRRDGPRRLREGTKAAARDRADASSTACPGVEVLAVELAGPGALLRLRRPSARGRPRALRARHRRSCAATSRDYTVDVSSPGIERPLRKPAHFAQRRRPQGRAAHRRARSTAASGSRARWSTQARTRVHARASTATSVDIPYEAIVRGNLIDEGGRA